MQPRHMQTVQALLRQNFLIPIYKDYTEWAHDLYAKHVRPAMLLHHKRVPHRSSIQRRAHLSIQHQKSLEKSV